MSANDVDTEQLRELVKSQASTILDLQAELSALRASLAIHTTTSTSTASSSAGTTTVLTAEPVVKKSRPKRVLERNYLEVRIYFPWNQKRLLRLLDAVTEVMKVITPDDDGLDEVLKRYVGKSNSDPQPTVAEVEYALGKIYHDGHRVNSGSICSPPIYQYLEDHPEVSTFFKTYLGSPPYYGPN